MEKPPQPRQTQPQKPATCPKCGFVQPMADECARCGVLFAKAATVSEWANRPEMVPRSVVERYGARIQASQACLVPEIDQAMAESALAPYITGQSVWEDGEECVFNESEEILAIFHASAVGVGAISNLVLTNMKLLTVSGGEAPVCTGYDLFSIQSVQLKGAQRELLQIGKSVFRFTSISPEDIEARLQFAHMLQDIIRGLRQADSAARDKARRSSRAGDAPQIGQGLSRARPTLPPDAITIASITKVTPAANDRGARPFSETDSEGLTHQSPKAESNVGSVFKKFLGRKR